MFGGVLLQTNQSCGIFLGVKWHTLALGLAYAYWVLHPSPGSDQPYGSHHLFLQIPSDAELIAEDEIRLLFGSHRFLATASGEHIEQQSRSYLRRIWTVTQGVKTPEQAKSLRHASRVYLRFKVHPEATAVEKNHGHSPGCYCARLQSGVVPRVDSLTPRRRGR